MFNSTLVGQRFPDFTSAAVMGDGSINSTFNLAEIINNKFAVLFFYPLDFTFVCPTELLAFNQSWQSFQDKNAELIAISVDSEFSHLAWRNTSVKQGGIGPVKYPMVSDLSHEICQLYGVEHPVKKVAYRATCIIDNAGIIRHQSINDLPIGREPSEYLRLLDAIIHHDTHGEVCPAGWQKGKPAMETNQASVAAYLEEMMAD
ncbi:MAG: hypothetical protein CMF46_00765 [Legionellales bacterium]|nr:hypothetical protein [Legionellales bacterium]